jgi:hypothetical protein
VLDSRRLCLSVTLCVLSVGAYRYGSVIFINVSEAERAHCLAMLKPFAIPAHGQTLAPPDESGLRMDSKLCCVSAPARASSSIAVCQALCNLILC